jgi:PAS domain S-box-containing protein
MLPDPLHDVLATDALDRRASRSPNYPAENESLRELMVILAREPERTLTHLVERVMALCGAESAALSVITTPQETLRWEASVGLFAPLSGYTHRWDDSIGKVPIIRRETVLLDRPGRLFSTMRMVEPEVSEVLITPVYEGEAIIGALWVANHGKGRPFDTEDRRLLESLAGLAAVAWRAQSGRTAARTSSEFLRLVTDRLPVRVAYVDRNFRFRFMNDGYERQAGISRKDAIGKTISEALGGAVFETVRANFERAFAGETHSSEFEAPYPSGTRRILVTYVPDVGASGEVRGAVVQSIDVTEQRRAEAERRTSDERYRTIFESIDEGFCIVEMIKDESGRYVDYRYLEINPAFERASGIPAEVALSGQTVREILPDYETIWIDTYAHVAQTGETAHLVNEVKGLGRWFEMTATRLGGAGSNTVAIVFNDISDRQRAEMEQTRLLSELATERERLTTLFRMSPSAIALIRGDELRFEYANPAYLGLIRRDGIVGKTLIEALPELADQGFEDLLREVMRTGVPYRNSEAAVQLKHAPHEPVETLFLDFLYQPMTDPAGVFVHAIDVTAQVVARNAIAQSEEQFRTAFEQATDDAILLLDLDRTVRAWNPAAERITGWTAEEVVGQSADLLFTAEDRANGVPDQEAEVADRKGKAEDERWHLRKDDSRFWGSGTMNSLHDSDGNVRGYLKVFRDATERYETEQRILQLVEERTAELQRAMAESEGFNYSISHDLRAPLRAIVSTSRILLDDLGPTLEDEHRSLLERQAFNANRMGVLIDELLRLSRLSRVEVVRKPLDMTAKARAIAAELEHGCQVEVQEGMTAMGDPGLVRTILHNLIGNACKFSPQGGTIRVRQEGPVFSVSDEGVGFDPKFAPKIFLPFERLVRDDEFPGTGIGLANVKRIVERHHGRVWAESEPGKGSTFSFTLGEPSEILSLREGI